MQKVALRMRAWGSGLLAAAVLTACGGGGSDSAPPPPPTSTVTPIPDNLAITAPTAAESTTAVPFGSSTGNLAGLKYQWDFGDGATSVEATPNHSFANGGEYDVVLKVTNEAGTSREIRTKLSITNVANVRGLECSGPANTGWCWQNPRPTGNRVNSVFFLNATTGWRGGENGEVFKTTDGGTTWVRQNTGVAASITGIKFLDANRGWAVGAFGAMLRTTDGGTTWAVSKGPDGLDYMDASAITVVDARTVYVGHTSGTYDGNMGATFDGGATWNRLSTAPNAVTRTGKLWRMSGSGPVVVSVASPGGQTYTNVLDIKLPEGDYVDTTSLVASGDLRAAISARTQSYDFVNNRYRYYEAFYTTHNGGATWVKVEFKNVETATRIERLLSISEDGKTLAATGDSGLVRSTDGGATWVASATPGTNPFYSSFYPLQGNDVAVST